MSTQAETPDSIPNYDPGLFVNREPEIKIVTDMAQALAIGEEVHKRTLVFWGYKGSGRTWLLKHLEEVLADKDEVKVLYLDLEGWAGCETEQAIREIITCIAEQLTEWLGSSAETAGEGHSAHCEGLQNGIPQLLDQYVAALLVDHVYESDSNLLERLEEHVLALAAVQSRVLIIMAGRGQAFPWKTPELRLYTEDYHLERFNETLTQEQLQRQRPEAALRTPEIYTASQGYPLANLLLAARPTIALAMRETVNGLLDDVEGEERTWLEALCVLRAFDEDHIPHLLAAYFGDDSISRWEYKEVRQARDRLLHTRVVRWDEEAGGWEVDRAIRPVLEKYLQEVRPEIWERLHRTALQLYRSWESQYPDEQDRWRDEADYHAERLRAAGCDPDQAE